MASAMLKLMVFTICINTFLYLGINYAIYGEDSTIPKPDMQNDLFSIMLSDKDATDAQLKDYASKVNNNENITSAYKFNLSDDFSSIPSQQQGSSVEPDAGGFSFLDGIRMVYAFAITMWRIATIPITMFSYNILPPFVAVIFAFPLLILNVITVIVFLRGGGAI